MHKDHFTYSISDISKTGIFMISVHDSRTGFTVRTAIPDHGQQSASLMAFAGARFSRSSDTSEDIFAEIAKAGSNAQEKLANIFRNYGHASVADMANLFVYIENISKHHAARFFNETSIGGGQERSSRYQDFGSGQPEELDHYFPDSSSDEEYVDCNTLFKEIQSKGIHHYNTWKEKLTERYTELYDIDTDNKREMSALSARVFDTARSFLTSGLSTRTSLAWISNAREWARLIGVFKGSQDTQLQCLAQQIEALLAPDEDIAQSLGYVPEAPDLIKYTQADEKGKTVRSQLREFLQTYGFESQIDALHLDRSNSNNITIPQSLLESRLISEYSSASYKAVIQNILLEYPSVDYEYCQSFVYSLPEEAIDTLSKIVFSDFDHHTQMSVVYRINQLSYDISLSNAEAIDFNRHRAWGRFSPLWSSENTALGCLENGYVLPLYISDVPELLDLKESFVADLESIYDSIREFVKKVHTKPWFNEWIIPQMVPLAHNARLIMHGSIKEVSYMTKLRVRPGGQINYRDVAYQIAEQTSFNDPLLTHIRIDNRPDPRSRDEFIDRS
jgi:thymidylate synthase ThyX